MIIKIITDAAIEPVTVLEAKEQLRVEASFTLDDSYIGLLISAARARCESYCNDFFSVKDIEIHLSGDCYINSGLTVTAATVDGVAVGYTYNSVSGLITFDTVGSEYIVTATTSAPLGIAPVNHAIKMIVTDLYELRTETVVGESIAMNPAVKALLYPFRKSLGI